MNFELWTLNLISCYFFAEASEMCIFGIYNIHTNVQGELELGLVSYMLNLEFKWTVKKRFYI